jgi:DNA-binding NarL/FixJ family response regulator
MNIGERADLQPIPPEPLTLEQRLYMQRLDQKLQAVATVELPDNVVASILDQLSGWECRTSWDNEMGTAGKSLVREVSNLSKVPDVANFETPRREVLQDEDSVTIKVKEVIGNDIRALLTIERQLSAKPKPPIKRNQWAEETVKFASSDNVFINEADVFTDREAVVMSLLTHFSTYSGIALTLDTSESTISRVVWPVRRRLDLPTNIDLTLAAITLRAASIDHIPRGKTTILKRHYLDFIAKYCSVRPSDQLDIQSMPAGTIGSNWKRILDKLEVNDRSSAVVHAVKDGIIELPNPADFRPGRSIE